MIHKIALVAGGTGGHFYPALGVATKLASDNLDIHLITDLRCKKYLANYRNNKVITHIIDVKPSSLRVFGKFISVYRMAIATLNNLLLFYRIKPRCVVGFGGYPSVPSLVAALILRIPIILHEQNCFMGKANKCFLKYSAKIAVAYRDIRNLDFQKYNAKIVYTGSILRPNISVIKPKKNFKNEPFVLFVFGGSQGAKVLSELIPKTLRDIKTQNRSVDIQVIQQAPGYMHDTLLKQYKDIGVEAEIAEFFYDIEQQYERANLVISRAGASTIAELSAIGLPAIFIPYPYATDNHQFYNANSLEEKGASWCIEEKQALNSRALSDLLVEILKNRSLLAEASAKMLEDKKDGCLILADTIKTVI